MRSYTTRIRALAALLGLALSAACGAGGGQDASPTRAAASGEAADLRSVCPATIVIQTSWLPDAPATGALYHLLGPNPAVDTAKKRVTAPLVVRGKDSGVDLQIRAGGPAIGFNQVSAQMYLDQTITLGLPKVDEQIQLSSKQPTLAVLALLETDPQIIMWDPGRHPEFTTIADIGKTGTTVLYVGGDTYMEYLIGSGVLKRGQVDGSQDGSPARFVASRGNIAQSGYATVDPYTYQNEVRAWGKPVRYQLVYQTGYPNYGEILAIRANDKNRLAPCLKKLVPIVQQAMGDFVARPAQTIDLVVRLNDEYRAGVLYSKGNAEFAMRQARELNLISNGGDRILGNFDRNRIQRLIDITGPIFAAQKKPIHNGLTPSHIYTNEFTGNIGLTTRQ